MGSKVRVTCFVAKVVMAFIIISPASAEDPWFRMIEPPIDKSMFLADLHPLRLLFTGEQSFWICL